MALDYNIIGERLKQARLIKRLTQEKLAEELNVSVAFLSRIERGSSHISLKRLNQICSILHVSEGEILNGVSEDSEVYLNKNFFNLLKSCPAEKISLIYNIAKVIVDT
ncbi:MAG: helix-turn-helix transcriptional regulator [Clostridia bacterium]|nr:helix-turn-helix transcriptional regulator [Clostridia bacterium]